MILLSPGSLCSLHNRPMKPRDEVLRQGRDFNRGAGKLRRRQLGPQNNHLTEVWMAGSFIDHRERSNEKLKSKGRIEREAVGK